MRFDITPPTVGLQKMKVAGAQYRKDLRAASVLATDRASKDGQRAVQNRIRSVGLGKLSNAVGHTSSKRERNTIGDPYGVIFARGGDDSLGGGALESYSRGANIYSQKGKWLAFPTAAVPKFTSVNGRRRRTTPALFLNRSGRGPVAGAMPNFGRLVFKPIGPNRAVLVLPKASVSIRTGRAKAPNKRKSKLSTNEKDVVAFVLIRITRRAQRFDHRQIMQSFGRRLPRYIKAALDEIRRAGQ